jgi:hypothetical protein
MTELYDRHDCPYCATSLDPLPKAKKRCPACGQPIYVRSAPDGVRHLLREADLAAHEERWEAYREMQAEAVAWAHNVEAGRLTREALRTYREAGMTLVEIMGADDPCRACGRAARVWGISVVPAIPVPGCTNEICRCDYLPVIS